MNVLFILNITLINLCTQSLGTSKTLFHLRIYGTNPLIQVIVLNIHKTVDKVRFSNRIPCYRLLFIFSPEILRLRTPIGRFSIYLKSSYFVHFH